MNLKKWMVWVMIIFAIPTITFFTLSFFLDDDWIEIVGVTLITTYFHVCIRPLTGSIINLIFHNKMNYNRWWFKPKKIEKIIFKILLVKKWKNFMPTYDKDAFNVKNHTLEEIIGATCQAEIVHELMLIEALLPLLLIIPYGTWYVFVSTSILCVIIELVFIIIQRYNRPRMMILLKRQQRKKD